MSKLGDFTAEPIADLFDQSSGRRKPKRKKPHHVYRPRGEGKAYVHESGMALYLQEQGLEHAKPEALKEGTELVFMLREATIISGEKSFRPYLSQCSFVKFAGKTQAHILIYKGEKRLPKVVWLDSLFVKRAGETSSAA